MRNRASGKIIRKHKRNPDRVQKYIHGPLHSCPLRLRRSQIYRLHFVLRMRRNRDSMTFIFEFSACAQRYHATKNSCGLAPQAHASLSMHSYIYSCKTIVAISPPDSLISTNILHFCHGDIFGLESTRKKIWISIMINK